MAIGGGWTSWRGSQITNRIEEAAVRSVKKTCDVVLQSSKSEVPLDEGILEKTGIVIMAANNVPQGVVCYGGGAGTGRPFVPYAIRWHERQANFQHGRKRFYLRDPFNRLAMRTLKEMIRQEMRGLT